MKTSKTGYKRNSKDKDEPALKIPSNNITMKGVDFPVFGVDDMGYSQMMYPGMDYLFPGNHVYEIPMAQIGGDPSIPNLSNRGWLSKYQKGGPKSRIYTNKEEFAKANQVYNDSLFLYNQGEKDYDLYLKMSAERPDIRTHNSNDPVKDDDHIQPIKVYGFAMTDDDWEKTGYPDKTFRYKKPTTLPVYQPKPEVKPIKSKPGVLPITDDKGLMPSKKLQVKEGLVPTRETYYANFNPNHPDAGKIIHYYDPVKKQIVKNPEYELRKDGGWLQKYQHAGQVMTYASNPEYFDNHAVYHDNPKANDIIRSKVYAGTHGWDPVNNTLVKLDKPVSVPAATRERATEDWGKKTYQQRFESDTPAGREVRESAVKRGLQEMVHNPLLYAPAAAVAGVFAGPAIASGIGAALEAPLVIGSTTVPGVTAGSTLGAFGAGLSTQQLLDPTSTVRQSINVAAENPNTENVLTAVGEVGLTGLGYVGLGIGKGLVQGSNAGYKFLNKQSQSAKNALNDYLISKQGAFAKPYAQGELSNTLSPEEFSRLKQLDEASSLLAYNNPNRNDLVREFVSKSSLTDDEIREIFGRSREEILTPKPEITTPTEPATTRINLSRPERASRERNQLPPPPSEIDIDASLSVPAYLRRNIDVSNLPEPQYRDIIGRLDDIINNRDFYDQSIVDVARILRKTSLKDIWKNTKGLFENPVEKSYERALPSLSARSFNNRREMLEYTKKNIEEGIKNAPLNTVVTGSTNTSYNSYLPQMDFVFKNAKTQGLSEPIFLGYHPMNNAGFLSDTNVSNEEILKFINTSLNKIQKKSKANLNLGSNAPYMDKNGEIWLPQYGLKKLDNSFKSIKKEYGGWLSQYRKGGNANFDASYLTSNTNWLRVPEGNWVMGMQDGGIMKLQNAEKKRINTAAKGFNDYIINVTLSKSGGSTQGDWLNKYK